jgi:hypothetical protein
MPLGATSNDLLLNAYLRGSVGTPATSIYVSLGLGVAVPSPGAGVPRGSYSAGTEITGFTRASLTLARTTFCANTRASSDPDSAFDFADCSGGGSYQYVTTPEPIDLWLGSGTPADFGKSATNKLQVQLYDAATNGNLLYFSNIYGSLAPVGLNPYDVVQFWGLDGYAFSTWFAANDTGDTAFTNYRGRRIWGAMVDWLFRGGSFAHGTGSFANLYASLGTVSGTTYTEGVFGRVSITRNTSNWSAPAQWSTSAYIRSCTNVNALAFPNSATGGASSFNACALHLNSSPTPGYNDIVFLIQRAAVNYNNGDTVTINANDLEVPSF